MYWTSDLRLIFADLDELSQQATGCFLGCGCLVQYMGSFKLRFNKVPLHGLDGNWYITKSHLSYRLHGWC